MGVQRTSFEKLQRDRAKKAKAAAKREKRFNGGDNAEDGAVDPAEVERLMGSEDKELSAAELLELIEKIHQQFENEDITFEEFEERKIELFARLPID
jgi:Ca2+-binding EF-hand superfamily protein